MDRVGAVMWTKIEAGERLPDIVGDLVAAYTVSADEAGADVARLVQDQLREEIAVPVDGAAVHADPAAPSAFPPATGRSRLPYAPPVLLAYRDMGDLLALDPPAPELKDLRWKA